MDDKQNANMEFREIINVIRKRYYIILIITIPALLISLYFYSVNKPKPLYFVKTSLIVGNSINNKGEKFQTDDISRYNNLIGTYCYIAKTSIVSQKTIKELNLAISPQLLQKQLTAEPNENTQFMDLSLTWPDSSQAVEILNTFTNVFIQEAENIYPNCSIGVMEKVSSPQLVIHSQKKVLLLLGLIGGIVISILLIFAIELFDDTLRTEEDVERCIKLSVIGAVPKEKVLIQEINLNTIEKIDLPFVEAYRTLRNNIFSAYSYKGIKLIVIASSKPSEGKTITASMLSLVMAQAGKKTILVDCDLRRPTIHKKFDVDCSVGLTNILNGEARWFEAMHKSEIENLFVLSSGNSVEDSSGLLSSSKMKVFMGVLKNDFDYIILDTPAVGLITDAQVLTQVADGYILVVSCGETSGSEAMKTKKIIENSNGRIIGVSLNKVKNSYHQKYFKRYYGSKKQNDVKYLTQTVKL